MFKVLGHSQCDYCKQAIRLLAEKGKSFTYLDIRAQENEEELIALKQEGKTSVPQIWDTDTYVGGFTELREYL